MRIVGISLVRDEDRFVERAIRNVFGFWHDLIKGHAGEAVWVFGVDGDELYDPVGLARFREQLLAGEAAEDWLVRANMLHCVELDEEHGRPTGNLSPPAPSVSKLFNFARIEAWDGDNPERLHDPSGLVFKPGAEPRKRELNREYGWDDSSFRALHVCFLRRSSQQRTG